MSFIKFINFASSVPTPGDNPEAPENPPVLTPDPASGILNLLRGDIFYKDQLAYIA